MESEGVVPLNNKIFNPNMTNHTIDVYYFPMSAPARATMMLVRALGLKHNPKIVNLLAGENQTPEYLKLNPLHQVPTLNDNGFVLTDSNAIMKYLVDQYAKDDSLYPRDAKRGAIVTQRLFFCATYLFPRFIDYHIPTLMQGKPPNPESKSKLDEALNHLNNFIEGQSYVAGEYLTVADFSIIGLISTIDACESVDLKDYPNIWQWFNRTRSAMSGFGYEEINQNGVNMFGNAYKSKLS